MGAIGHDRARGTNMGRSVLLYGSWAMSDTMRESTTEHKTPGRCLDVQYSCHTECNLQRWQVAMTKPYQSAARAAWSALSSRCSAPALQYTGHLF